MESSSSDTRGIGAGLSQLVRDAEQSAKLIKLAIADAVISEREGQSQLLEQQRAFQEQRVVLAERQVQQLKDILSKSSDPDKQADINKQLLSAEGVLVDARLAIARTFADEAEAGRKAEADAVKAQLERREAEEKAALERIESANRESDARITQSQQQRSLAIKQQQLSGVLSAEEASAAIAQIEQDGIAETVQARRAELTEVIRLRDAGVINAEESRSRELALNEEIGKLNIQRIDVEIEAQERARVAALKAIEDQKKATIEAIESTAALQVAPLDSRKIELDIGSFAADSKSGLLSAQLEQQQAIAQVEQTRFDIAIQRAELIENDAEVDRLKLEQLRAQEQATLAAFEIQRQQLTLAQEQRAIEAEQRTITAEIAAIEAEVNLQKAIANEASAEEIANLRTILDLRERQVSQATSAEQNLGKLNALESSALSADQANERAKSQLAIEEELGAIAKRQSDGDQGDVATTLSAEDREQQRIANGQRYGFNASGSSLSQLRIQPSLDVEALKPIADLGGLGTVVQQGNGQVVQKLDELNRSILQLANTPRSITVSAPDPVGAVEKVLSDVAKTSFRRAGL